MIETPIAVTGAGMVSALGFDVATSCAAARAGVRRAATLECLESGVDKALGDEPIVGHTVAITNGATGLGKAVALGSIALRDLCVRMALADHDLVGSGIVINISDRQLEDQQAAADAASSDAPSEAKLPSEVWRERTSGLIDLLAASCGLAPFTSAHRLVYGGHTGFAQAMETALKYLRSGSVNRCIVGAIDSLVEPSVLRAAHSRGLLKTGSRPIGFLPGEAAGFLLLETDKDRSARRRAIGKVAGVSRRNASGSRTDPPSKGKALARAIDDVLTDPNTLFIGDLNGQESRGVEWGYAQVDLTRRHPESQQYHVWLPAQHFGEIGAASGAVAACMALRSFERAYAPSDKIIAWLSSDTAETAAIRIGTWS